MVDQENSIGKTDEKLVAYLGGQASAEEAATIEEKLTSDVDISARLALLDAGSRPFREAFDLMLEAAPAQKLQEQLEEARNTMSSQETVNSSATGVSRLRDGSLPGSGVWSMVYRRRQIFPVF